jgi:hypothetical protein
MKKEKRKKPILTFFSFTFSLFFPVVLSLGGLLSCGLEGVAFIDYIPPQNVTYGDTNTSILLSGDAEGASFDNFIIFYRIYISNEIVPTGDLRDNSNARSAINATLNSDYNTLYIYTDITSTTVNTANLENTFSNRRYFLLTLVNSNGGAADINSVLSSGSLGQRLIIAFPTNDKPTLTINGTVYDLQRAVRNEILNLYDLNPAPDRRFFNHSELYNTANVTSGRNADVATVTGSGTPFYTYVSMYIAAKGTSTVDMPPRIVYSQPTFIGIFQLANSGG